MSDSDFDEDERDNASKGSQRVHKEFDCPTCNANNPTDAPLRDEDEVRCNYCGDEFKVLISDEGKMRLKEA